MIANQVAGLFGVPYTAPLTSPAYESIATITPYTTTTTVSFTSIPSTFTHLQLRGFGAASTAVNLRITFNGDTSTNYTYHYLEGNGTSVAAGGGGGSTTSYIVGPVLTNTGSAYTGIVMDILDYKNTNKYKTTRTLYGVDLNGSSTWMGLGSGLWFSTSAISSITLTLGSGTYAANSHWALYGIKG